jgi:hypothetical protein
MVPAFRVRIVDMAHHHMEEITAAQLNTLCPEAYEAYVNKPELQGTQLYIMEPMEDDEIVTLDDGVGWAIQAEAPDSDDNAWVWVPEEGVWKDLTYHG